MTHWRFAFFVAVAAAFVVGTSSRLPPVVASHFGAPGLADGFMSQRFYVVFMLALLVGLPSLLVALTSWSLGRSNSRINLPHKEYWLAPERRGETVAYLRSSLMGFGAGLVSFLCYVHWLVVLANEQSPPRLANAWFVGGLLVFVMGLLVWLGSLRARFRRSKP